MIALAVEVSPQLQDIVSPEIVRRRVVPKVEKLHMALLAGVESLEVMQGWPR